jgi:YVTN family beta-propeller protein
MTFDIAEYEETTSVSELAYVTMSDSNVVALIDTSTQTAVGSIYVGANGCSFPWRATMSPDGSSVYVGCFNSGNVVVIDTASNTVVTTINSIPSADDIAFTPDGSYAFVGSRSVNQIKVIDTTTLTVISTISTPGETRSLAAHPTLDVIYATSGTGAVLVIDSNTFAIIDIISISAEPWDIAVTSDGQWLFTGDRWGSGLYVIDTASNSVFTIVTGLSNLTGLAVAPDNTKLYAASLGNGVHVIDIPSFTPITTIGNLGTVWETAVTCNGSELYIGNTSSSVPIVDTNTQTLITQVSVTGFTARGIAICPEHRIVNVPWLSTDPTSGILPTSSALPVTVTFNATN